MPDLKLKEALESLEADLTKKYEKYEKELEETGSVSKELKATVKSMADDYKGMTDEIKKIVDQINALNQKGTKGDPVVARKTMGQEFVESPGFAAFKSGEQSKGSFLYKNTIIGEGGSPQDPTNDIVPLQTMPGIIGGAFRALRIMDVVMPGVATGNQVHYTRELLYSNAAAETREGAAKAESTLTFEPVDENVRTIAHFLKASKQILDDAPQLASYIDMRMRYGVDLRIEQQIVNGNGTSPNLKGMFNSDNNTALAAVSGEASIFDLANRAKYAVIAADYSPDYFLMNPADWGKAERTKDSNGAYLAGDGAIGYLNNGLIPTLWGLPVITSNSVPVGEILCSSLDNSMFWRRQETTVEIFEQDEDNVQKNLITIRGEARGAFGVFRPAAAVKGDISVF